MIIEEFVAFFWFVCFSNLAPYESHFTHAYLLSIDCEEHVLCIT